MAAKKYHISNFDEVQDAFNAEFHELVQQMIPIEKAYWELKKQMAPYCVVNDKLFGARDTHILDTRAINQLSELIDVEIQKEDVK